ncbi:hypothetical protein CDD82_3738 [Ophiocordyceps australis]|uniref:RING-type domain-containing protein n=1 Tax=Ophiocordyceps australis TaxID=1399860 RepID=A0A2C5ZC19_9HYPO|nr:hypothetical protein CDD82_3738 [Ophiocordyceps australis]
MASSISEAQAELVSSLSPDDIPIKLRCAICSKLAVNAFRLPCCEQAICETCQSTLPQSCPVCEHSPLASEDCNPNKSLRTTIRVFLRTAEKKRESNRPKESNESAPVTPIEARRPSLAATEVSAQEVGKLLVNGTCHGEEPRPGLSSEVISQRVVQEVEAGGKKLQAGEGGPGEVNQGGADGARHGEGGNASSNGVEEEAGRRGVQDDGQGEQGVVEMGGMVGEEEGDENSFGMNNGFSNAMFAGSGDFGQMQMMMAMQNGMGSNSFGGFPMMGMGMDPMTMQSMYVNGGFQGMGMNGMGGFGGGLGQGAHNNWNGTQSWSFDQNNYNQMGSGDFEHFDTGFQTGYNSGNYGHFNEYRRGFGRGRGRGRGFYGGYGRGGYHQHGGAAHHAAHGFSQQVVGGYHSYGEAGARGDATEAKPVEGDGHDKQDAAWARGDAGAGRETANEANHGSRADKAGSETGAMRSVLLAPDVPINAPTGPKAMRQGLPNTSLHHLRARGYQIDADPAPSSGPQHQGPCPRDRSRSAGHQSERHVAGRARGRSREASVPCERADSGRTLGGDSSRTVSQRPDKSRSRSRSRGHRSSRRHARRRSVSGGGDDDAQRNGSHGRKKHRGSRRHHGDDDNDDDGNDNDNEYRSPSASPVESRKSGHRGHRDRGYEKHEKEQVSGHRSHRGRDHNRDRNRDDSHRDDSRRRDRDRRDRRERHERDHRHDTSSRRPSDEDASLADASHERERHGSSHTAKSAKDPQTLEREARDRERLLKEAQRMAGLASLAGNKRGRDGGGDDDGGRKSRRASRRSEARDGDEERLRRLEAEREGGRWD